MKIILYLLLISVNAPAAVPQKLEKLLKSTNQEVLYKVTKCHAEDSECVSRTERQRIDPLLIYRTQAGSRQFFHSSYSQDIANKPTNITEVAFENPESMAHHVFKFDSASRRVVSYCHTGGDEEQFFTECAELID